MKPSLYAHPFASYCQKVLVALYENDTPFSYRKLVPEDPSAMSELGKLWPLKKFPALLDDGRVFFESSVIIEYLAIRYPGRIRLIPADALRALEVRMLDRFFDNYVMTPMQRIGGGGIQHGGLCRRSVAVLFRLGARNRRKVRPSARLPKAAARTIIDCAHGRRSETVSQIVSARRAEPRLTDHRQ